VCRTSGCKFGGNINTQLIGILSHCGVPTKVFKELLRQDLQETLGVINEFLDNPIALREWIANIVNMYEIRCSGAEYIDTNSGEEAAQEPKCITYTPDGVPTMPHEVCVTLLESGFRPKSSRYLQEKLKHVLNRACDKVSGKMHISLAKSTSLICIADHLGVLEEDEVSIRFGKPFKDEETGRYSNFIEGEVLVARVSIFRTALIGRIRPYCLPISKK
jgi:RNA dependent RNA polymerase